MAPRRQLSKRPRKPGLDLRRTLGPIVVRWIERNLVHGPGDVEGQRIELDDERVRFLLRVYAIADDGRRLINRAVISRPKGWAKSELLAMISCAEALGPVRFGGWDANGYPVGRPVQAPLIRLAATEEGQTDNTYAAVEYMLREGPLARLPGLDVGRTRTFTPNGGKIVGVTARASSKDGGRETFAGFDETHLYHTPELIKLHQTIRRNLAKRKIAEPWSMETTTAYAPGENSVAEASHAYAQKIAAGLIADPKLLFDHRQGPVDIDYHDDEQVRAGLIEAYGDAAAFMDIERIIAEIRDPQMPEDAGRRYYFNQPTVRENSWLDVTLWRPLANDQRTSEHLPKGTPIVLAFDGSFKYDSTALVGCTIEETPHVFVLGVWERPEIGGDEWEVPRHEVHAAVDDAMRWFDVIEFAGDPPYWQRELDEWADRYGDVVVTKFRTNLRSFMARACSKFHAHVMSSGMSHDGDEALERHIANAVVKATGDGEYITKDYKMSPRKIDCATAAVIALDRATERRDSNQSVYSRPGKELLVIGAPDVDWDDDEDEDWD